MNFQQALVKGTLLDGIYSIETLLGSGGFAKTYLANDLTLARQVAIKEFFPATAASRHGTNVQPFAASDQSSFEDARQRFEKEARTLSHVTHPNIVRVFRTFDANGTSYIVLEYVEGEDLEDWLQSLGRAPTQEEVDRFAEPLLGALDRVHKAGILHRDITPRNIRIRKIDHAPVLLDFGAAKTVLAEGRRTTIAIKTPGYASVELNSTDSKMLGAWTDIYGLAATFYRALAGAPPPESTERILGDTLVSATKLPLAQGNFRPAFLAGIDWGLAVRPEKRPQSVADWRARLMDGRTTRRSRRTRPPGTTTQPPTAPAPTAVPVPPTEALPPQPRRFPVAATLGGVLVLATGSLLAAWQLGLVDLNGSKRQTEITQGGPQSKAKAEAEAAAKQREQKEAERKRKDEQRQAQAKRDEEAKKKAEDEQRQAQAKRDEEAKKKAEDEQRQAQAKRDEEAKKKKAEDEQRQAQAKRDEEAKKKAEDEQRQAQAKRDEEAKKKAEDEQRQAQAKRDEEAKQRTAAAERSRTWQDLVRDPDGSRISAIAFGGGDNLLATGGEDGQLRVWRLGSNAAPVQSADPPKLDGAVSAIAFSSDGSDRLAAAERKNGTILFWDTKNERQLNVSRGPATLQRRIYALGRANASGAFAAISLVGKPAAGYRVLLETWDSNGSPIGEPHELQIGDRTVTAAAFSPNGDLYAVATRHTVPGPNEFELLLFAPGQDQPAAVLPAHGYVLRVVFSPHGERVATAGQSDQIDIWDVKDRREIKQLVVPARQSTDIDVTAIAFSLTGRFLASASDASIDNKLTLTVWDTDSDGHFDLDVGGAPPNWQVHWLSFISQPPDNKDTLAVPWHNGAVRHISIDAHS